MATKLRALYQRKKGRDLFDAWFIFKNKLVDVKKVIEIFEKYCAKDDTPISRTIFLQNMEAKRLDESFRIDMTPILPISGQWDFDAAYEFVVNEIISQLP